MAEAIRMPLLSDTMTEGVIAAWHKKVGDKVKGDDILAEVETDKATMEVMGYVDGTLLYIGVEQGKAAKVNGIIAIVGKEGEDFSALLDAPDNDAKNSEVAEKVAPAEEEKPAATSSEPPRNKDNKPTEDPEAAATAAGATIVRMPLLSDTMKEGKIVAWHKNVGDQVKGDDVLAEVETDKATMEVMGYADGILLYQGVKEGEAALVNGIIAIVGKEGTDVTPMLAAPAVATSDTQDSSNTTPPAPEQFSAQQTPASTTPPSAEPPQAPGQNGRVKASPLARRLASEKGIDLKQISGSGDNGRIIKRDVDEFKPSQAAPQGAAAGVQQAVAGPAGAEASTDAPVSQMRRVIAQRLSESKFSAPHFYLRISVTMDGAMAARAKINEVSDTKVSFNDLVIKACAAALRKHPAVNSSWMGDSIRTHQHINIGMAVAIDDGLIVPVVKFADTKSLSQIAGETNSLGEKAKTKKLQPQEFSGNTFTVSNLGMMDIDEFTAIINPPDACILAVGKIAPTPIVEDGQVVVRNIMKLTLSCDHRVVDGAVGARFLQSLKKFLENPVTMLA